MKALLPFRDCNHFYQGKIPLWFSINEQLPEIGVLISNKPYQMNFSEMERKIIGTCFLNYLETSFSRNNFRFQTLTLSFSRKC